MHPWISLESELIKTSSLYAMLCDHMYTLLPSLIAVQRPLKMILKVSNNYATPSLVTIGPGE